MHYIIVYERDKEGITIVYDVLNAYLENGLKIILHKIPDVKTISCGLWVKQGSSYETDENNGLAFDKLDLSLMSVKENTIDEKIINELNTFDYK